MDIILWRHAEAEDIAESDLARRLTTRGQQQALSMAAWLQAHLGNDLQRAANWRVIASPAARAQQTAAALGMRVETITTIAPDAPSDAILRAADWPENNQNVIVVGHQPTLGMVAARLINGVDGYVSVKKGAVWWFRHRQRDYGLRATLVAMVSPDTLAK